MGLIRKARTGLGCTVQIIGGILWAGGGLVLFIWTLYVLFSTFGVLALIVAIMVAPLTLLTAVLIVWFSTGVFPVDVLLLWVVMIIGMVVVGVGGAISGED